MAKDMGHSQDMSLPMGNPVMVDVRMRAGEKGKMKDIPCLKARLAAAFSSGESVNESPSLSTKGADRTAPPVTGKEPMRAGTLMRAALTLPSKAERPATVPSNREVSFMAVENSPMVMTAATRFKVVGSFMDRKTRSKVFEAPKPEVSAITDAAQNIVQAKEIPFLDR